MGAFVLSAIDGAPLKLPAVEYSAVAPHLILIGAALLLLFFSSMMREKASQMVYGWYTGVATIAAMVSVYYSWHDIGDSSNPNKQTPDPGAHSAFSGAIANDKFSLFAAVVVLVALFIANLVSHDWLVAKRIKGPELHVLMMLSAAGAMIMASANDLIVVFLGLEILSIALYVLAAFDRRSERSREAALKYLLLGGFSSAVFLYGIALTYGAVGTTNLSGIATFLATNTIIHDGLLLGGMVLLVVGLGFKVAAVPFHQWTPDVYEGSPTPVTGFMAATAKVAAFAAFLKIFAGTLATLRWDWQPLILVLAILTLIVGSVVACVQQNVKRMLAYSSISHAGFILLGLQAASFDGVSASLYYLLVYAFIVTGSFAVVALVGGRNDDRHGLDAYRGLAKTNPGVAVAFSILLVAQVGVPLTSGFLAKFYIMSALVEKGSYATAVFAMLVAAIAAFFYLRIVVAMWSPSASLTTKTALKVPLATWLAISLAVVFTVGLGVAPPQVIDAVSFARHAAGELFPSAASATGPQQ